MELIAEGVLNAIGSGLNTFFSQLMVMLLFALVIVFREDSVSAAGTVFADVVFEARFVQCIGVEVVFVGSGGKGVGTRVESEKGDGATVRTEELEKEVGLFLFDCELAEDLILMGAKLS
jgi:hypothetical protein